MHELAYVVAKESAAPGDEMAGSWGARAVAALRAATRGEAQEAAVPLAEVERSAERSGAALDLVIAGVARATLLGMEGQMVHARAELVRALRLAVGAAIDTERIIRLVRGIGDVLLVTGAARRRLTSSAMVMVCPADAVVIDARGHQLAIRGRMQSLERRPVVRRLLYALARHPSRVLDKEALADAVWNAPYDPRCHDDALKSNVLHLRRLLAESGVTIACGNPGYRLDASTQFLFVVPFDLLDSPGFTSGHWPHYRSG
jgi:Transcriptional regulatory protein, C terminal